MVALPGQAFERQFPSSSPLLICNHVKLALSSISNRIAPASSNQISVSTKIDYESLEDLR